MKDYDQWTQELSREIYVRNDEEELKVFWKMNEVFDDDMEEEE